MADKYGSEELEMTRGDSDNEFDFDLQVITTIGLLTTGGYPEDFDRIGSIKY